MHNAAGASLLYLDLKDEKDYVSVSLITGNINMA